MVQDATVPPNGLPFSCAAEIDRGHIVADADFQNRPDLVDAQRRQLEWRVGPPLVNGVYTGFYCVFFFFLSKRGETLILPISCPSTATVQKQSWPIGTWKNDTIVLRLYSPIERYE